MKADNFVLLFNDITPTIEELIKEGFSESFSNILINNLTILSNVKSDFYSKHSDESLFYFLKKYDVSNINIDIINFNEELFLLEEANTFVIAGFDGGFLTQAEENSEIKIIFSDDLENDDFIFCKNDEQFFKIILELKKVYVFGLLNKEIDMYEISENLLNIFPEFDVDFFLKLDN